MSERLDTATSRERLREAFDQLGYELVDVHDNLTVPSATPVRLRYESPPGVVDATEIENRIDRSDYAYIDRHGENGEKWCEFTYSATVFGEDAERAKLTLSTAGVTIVQDREEDLSWNFFRSLVSIAAEALEADLEWRGGDDG